MVRFLPALLVLILIFGVKPLQFLLILAIVALGLLPRWLSCPHRCPECGAKLTPLDGCPADHLTAS